MRPLLQAVALTVLITALWGGAVFAQDDRTLIPDAPVEGLFDAETPAQIYTFTASADDEVSVTISSDNPALVLTILLSDETGAIIGQALKTAGVSAVIESTLTTTGTYFVTLAPLPGAVGEFTILLEIVGDVAAVDTDADEAEEVEPVTTAEPEPTPTQEPELELSLPTRLTPEDFTPSQVLVSNGVQVELIWESDDDLNLEVRDPVGGTLFWGSRETPEGGSFGFDVNGLCEFINPDPPNIETAQWSGGALPTGSYEVLIYHRQACGVAAPVDFTVQVTVDGQPLDPVNGTINPPTGNFATVHLTSFTLREDGSAEVGLYGPYTDTTVLPISPAEVLAADAREITIGQQVEGVITNDQYFETFQFDGTAGEIVTVEMLATAGSLDTLLILFNQDGIIVADNDDIEDGVITDSRMENVRLPSDGTYTIFASRYGKDVAGTEGIYVLSLSSSGVLESESPLPAELVTLNLPQGDVEVTLRWNTTADIQLLVRDPFGEAIYDDNETARSGGILAQNAIGNRDCVTADGIPVYHIYWPPGNLRTGAYEIEIWYQSECGDTRPVFFDLFVVVNGELVLRESAGIQFNQRFVVSYDIDQTGNVTTYPGGIIGGSELIPFQGQIDSAVAIGPNQVLSGNITQTNKFDLYTFDGQAGDVVTINMAATGPTLDTLLFLIDPNGIEVAVNDDIIPGANTDSRIENFTLPQDGAYTIIATHYGGIFGGTVGGYTLSLNIVRPLN